MQWKSDHTTCNQMRKRVHACKSNSKSNASKVIVMMGLYRKHTPRNDDDRVGYDFVWTNWLNYLHTQTLWRDLLHGHFEDWFVDRSSSVQGGWKGAVNACVFFESKWILKIQIQNRKNPYWIRFYWNDRQKSSHIHRSTTINLTPMNLHTAATATLTQIVCTIDNIHRPHAMNAQIIHFKPVYRPAQHRSNDCTKSED